VIGLGSQILGDDGIGNKLVKDLKKELNDFNMTFKDAYCGGMEFIDLLKGFGLAFIIDGIKTGEGSPGDVYFMTASDHLDTLHLSSFHDMDFDTALQYAHSLGLAMPEKINIIGIEIEEEMVFSELLSGPLARKYRDLLTLIKNLIFSEINKVERALIY
jgi:hydrogenase maturation protease